MIAFHLFTPYFADSTYNFTSQIHNFDTFSISNSIKSNVQAGLEKYMENLWLFREIDRCGGGGLIERGAYLKFRLRGSGLIRERELAIVMVGECFIVGNWFTLSAKLSAIRVNSNLKYHGNMHRSHKSFFNAR